MRQATNLLLFGFLSLSLTSCSWLVKLLVANHSDKDILVRYQVPSDSVHNEFLNDPKTYNFSMELLRLHSLNEKRRPKSIPTNIQRIIGTNEMEIKLKPGQVVHIGNYASVQPRDEVILKYDLKVLMANDSTLTSTQINGMFKHWKNMWTDLLEVR